MHARNQLNLFYCIGCVVAAVTIGFMLQSWLAFALALAIVVSLKLQDGGIRLIALQRRQTNFQSRHRRRPIRKR